MNISTDLRKDGIWDDVSEEWSLISENNEELTFFVFNTDLTMFKHTTSSVTSAYLIKSQEKDEENDQFELSIVSDVGNKYIMIIDFKNDNLRFIYDNDGESRMVWHRIKSVWFEDE
ncbi:hypothetical protein [Constantimarinum furrinae]|uniref:hypothetical protein n=1 Tax=Constantimarinum furrinae TaxID=2562285 RepID=UPI00164B2368|nr:hypothetical protein [Constantimarinum furrinae]